MNAAKPLTGIINEQILPSSGGKLNQMFIRQCCSWTVHRFSPSILKHCPYSYSIHVDIFTVKAYFKRDVKASLNYAPSCQ